MAANKTKPTEMSVAAFVDALTNQGRRTDAKALIKLMSKATGEGAKMWAPRSSVSVPVAINMKAGGRATQCWWVSRRAKRRLFSMA